MQYYRCKCGERKAWGTMSPPRCSGCEKCGSDLSTHPDYHRPPLPHEFETDTVETDEGPKPLSRCRYCHRTKAQIEKPKLQGGEA